MIDHETLILWCHVGHHAEFSFMSISLVPQAFKIQCKVNLDRLRLLNQLHILYVMGHETLV